METIRLNKPDTAFIRAVEDESGQVVSRCYQCGNCTASCPMSFTYDYSASRLMRLIQAGQKDVVLSAKSLWMCASCETCTQRCPNKIDVARIMDVCRHMARREGRCKAPTVKIFWDACVQTMCWYGRIHEEGLLTMYMLRSGRIWTDLDLAPKMLPKGKMAILPHMIKGHREVSDIMRRFKEGAADEAVVRARLAADAARASEAPGGSMAASPRVNSPPSPAALSADPSGVPSPSPSCGISPTPDGWTGGSSAADASREGRP